MLTYYHNFKEIHINLFQKIDAGNFQSIMRLMIWDLTSLQKYFNNCFYLKRGHNFIKTDKVVFVDKCVGESYRLAHTLLTIVIFLRMASHRKKYRDISV